MEGAEKRRSKGVGDEALRECIRFSLDLGTVSEEQAGHARKNRKNFWRSQEVGSSFLLLGTQTSLHVILLDSEHGKMIRILWCNSNQRKPSQLLLDSMPQSESG